MKASHVILVSYPVLFVHVIINIDCCSYIYAKVCSSAVVTERLYIVLKYFDFVVSDDILIDSRLLLSTLDFLLSTLDFLLSTLDFLLSTLDFLLSTLDFLLSTLDFLLSTLDFLLSILDFLLSTLDFLLSTLDFYSRLSTFTLDSRLLLSTLDLYSRLSTLDF